MLEDAIILCGNCSPPTVRLAKVVLTGTNNDIMSRNIKKDAAVKYPIGRDVFALTRFVSNIVEENYLKVVGKNYNLSPLERQMDEITVGFPNVYAKNLRTLSEDNIMTIIRYVAAIRTETSFSSRYRRDVFE